MRLALIATVLDLSQLLTLADVLLELVQRDVAHTYGTVQMFFADRLKSSGFAMEGAIGSQCR